MPSLPSLTGILINPVHITLRKTFPNTTSKSFNDLSKPQTTEMDNRTNKKPAIPNVQHEKKKKEEKITVHLLSS